MCSFEDHKEFDPTFPDITFFVTKKEIADGRVDSDKCGCDRFVDLAVMTLKINESFYLVYL